MHSSQGILALSWIQGEMAEQASHDASHLCSAPLSKPLLHAEQTYRLAIAGRQVCDYVIMTVVIQQVDLLR